MEVSDANGASALCSGGGEATSQTYAGDTNHHDDYGENDYDDDNGDNNHYDVIRLFEIAV